MSDELVLIVDDDPDIRTFLEVTLSLGGFEVAEATNGAEAVATAVQRNPALVLMDVMMPTMDGMEAVRTLRADSRTSHIPVIMVTAKAQGADKIAGFTQGADDYITKPFDPDELLVRVQATLRRAAEMRSVSPLTSLPGNARIELELKRRVDAAEEFALLYADLNQFKAYNDHYGFLRGDAVIRKLAEVTVGVVADEGTSDAFVGHVGGDDFVVITDIERATTIAEAICRRLDEAVPALYDPEDRERGFIEVKDRQGTLTRFGLVSVSIGIAFARVGDMSHPTEPVAVATEMKSYAKSVCTGPSNWAVDRRDGRGPRSGPGEE